MTDERDFLIISHLRRNPFASYETLGRGIGLSGNAVKRRIEVLEDGGVLVSLRAVPVAQVFGMRPRLSLFKNPVSVSELKSALGFSSVVFGTVDINRSAAILTYEKPDESGPADRLVALLGPVDLTVRPLYPYPQDALLEPVSIPELRVLRALVGGVRLPLKDIAESAGMSQKMTRKVRKGLLGKGLFQVQPIIQSARSSRIIMYEIHVHSHDGAVLERVKRDLPRSVFINQWEHTAVIFCCWADSISEVFEAESRVKAEEGVTAVRVKFHAKALLNSERLTSWIDAEIERLEGERNGRR